MKCKRCNDPAEHRRQLCEICGNKIVQIIPAHCFMSIYKDEAGAICPGRTVVAWGLSINGDVVPLVFCPEFKVLETIAANETVADLDCSREDWERLFLEEDL